MKTPLLGALCGATLASGALAQDATAVDPATIALGQRMAISYAHLSNAYFEEMLEPAEMLALFMLTKQEIVSVACDGYVLDEDRMSASLDAIMATQPMHDGQPNAQVLGRVMHGYGIIKGGEMALATYDPDAYCTYGEDIIAELTGDPREEELLVLRAAR